MDLKELREALDSLKFDNGGAVWESALRGEHLIDRVFKSLKPTIAAVNGAATAGGAGLLSACDMVVAVPEARIGYPEMKVGIQAGMVLLHLMRLVGERQARYLILTGDLISAAQAKEIGLINEVVAKEELMPTALRWANSVAMNGPKAEVISKSLLREFSVRGDGDDDRPKYAAAPHLTDECRAGLTAFFAKQRSSLGAEALGIRRLRRACLNLGNLASDCVRGGPAGSRRMIRSRRRRRPRCDQISPTQ